MTTPDLGHPVIRRSDAPSRPSRNEATLVTSALGMMTGKAAAMFLGFAFWLLAARVAPADHVGLAAGATATIMLVTLVSSSGLGAASVVHYHRPGHDATDVIDTVITIASVIAFVVGGGFLVFAGGFLPEMGQIADDPLFVMLFLSMSVIGTVGVVMDQISMAQRRGADVMVRNTTNGLVTLIVPGILWLGYLTEGARLLFAGWVLGSASAVVVGTVQLRRAVGRWSRPRYRREIVGKVAVSGITNQLLTTAERAPGLVLPLLVTELMSPGQNAYWYTSWMVAWGVSVVPLSTGTALFAEVARNPTEIARPLRSTLRSSLVIGCGLALVVFAVAPIVLGFAGADYADAGVGPLRLLVLGVVPACMIYPYYAIARSTGRIGEAIATASVTAVVGVVCAAVVGAKFGLTPMALSWVSVQAAAGTWSAARLRVWAS